MRHKRHTLLVSWSCSPSSSVSNIGDITCSVVLLRLCDGDTPCVGKVYHKVFQLGEELSNFEGLSVVQKREVTTLFTSRWDMMYSDMHGAGHALDPEYQVGGYWGTFTSLSFVPYFF